MHLKPVSQWTYALYRVDYRETEDGPIGLTKYFIAANDSHLESDIQEFWPSPAYHRFDWEIVQDNVTGPKVIGNLYGIPLHESGHEAGRRMAESLFVTYDLASHETVSEPMQKEEALAFAREYSNRSACQVLPITDARART